MLQWLYLKLSYISVQKGPSYKHLSCNVDYDDLQITIPVDEDENILVGTMHLHLNWGIGIAPSAQFRNISQMALLLLIEVQDDVLRVAELSQYK